MSQPTNDQLKEQLKGFGYTDEQLKKFSNKKQLTDELEKAKNQDTQEVTEEVQEEVVEGTTDEVPEETPEEIPEEEPKVDGDIVNQEEHVLQIYKELVYVPVKKGSTVTVENKGSGRAYISEDRAVESKEDLVKAGNKVTFEKPDQVSIISSSRPIVTITEVK